MKLKPAEKWLIELCPHMKCGHRSEFNQRLQWLSEGMLKNHLEHTINYTIDLNEIELYNMFKSK